MKKKLLFTMLISMVLIMSMSFSAFAEEGLPGGEPQGEDPVVEPEILNGWNDDFTMYYVDGKEVKECIFDVPEYGLYQFDKNGKVKTGTYGTYENLLYYFGKDEQGRAVRGVIFTGSHAGLYYENGKKFTGTHNDLYYRDGKKFTGTHNEIYYENGKKYTGTRTIDGKDYYYKSGKKYTGTRTIDGKDYYYKSGEKYTGTRTIDGKSYYYKNGRKYTGFKDSYYYKKGVKYVPDKAGAKKLGDYYYYVKKSGYVVKPEKSGTMKMSNGKYYYVFKSGHLKRFDKKGIHKIDGKAYYYTGNFTIKMTGKSEFEQIGSHMYRLSSKGYLVTGWHRYNNRTYYMSKSKYYRMTGGIKTIDGDKYYFADKGYIYKDKWYKKDGVKKYYFDKNGKKVVSRSVYIGKYRFFFNSKGTLQKDLIKYKGYDWVLKHKLKVNVNRKTNTVTIYAKDGDKGYTIPVCVFLCTTGTKDRPTDKGDYHTGQIYRWKELGGRTADMDNGDPCWGQYVTHIYGAVYFHSICYEKKNNHTLFTSTYNWLGNKGSHGCIRLRCGDAYKLYKLAKKQNMKVHIYDSSNPGAFGKPKLKKIWTNYDPTDPNIKK